MIFSCNIERDCAKFIKSLKFVPHCATYSNNQLHEINRKNDANIYHFKGFYLCVYNSVDWVSRNDVVFLVAHPTFQCNTLVLDGRVDLSSPPLTPHSTI